MKKSKIKINRRRPVEDLIGENYGIVRMRLGNFHCGGNKMSANAVCLAIRGWMRFCGAYCLVLDSQQQRVMS